MRWEEVDSDGDGVGNWAGEGEDGYGDDVGDGDGVRVGGWCKR